VIGVGELAIGALAVWRITHLLHAEDGPADVLVRFRRALGSGVLGRAVQCFYCLSVWVALPFSILLQPAWRERLLLWPALSAGAILLHEFIASRKPAEVRYYEEEEKRV